MRRAIFRVTLTIAAAACAGGASCRQPGTPASPPSVTGYDVGSRPRAIAVADFDGDGQLDVAVANSGDGTVSILLGAGHGRLRPAAGPPLPAGREPSDVDAGDLDRDGDADLLVANHETPSVTVLLNDGRAGFTAAPGSPFDTGARPHVHGLATGDFDGDGWMDTAVDSADTKEVRVLYGSPGGFGRGVAVPLETMPYYRLGAAEVTGDEHPDVLVPGHGDATVRVVRRDGGSLAPAPWAIRLDGTPWMVVGDDVSGDRRPDLLVVETDAVSVWLAGSDRFTAAPGSPFAVPGATEVAAGDLDGDGVADVAIGPWDGDQVIVLAGIELTPRQVRACERPIGLAIADLDGDPPGELLVACANDDRLVVVTSPLGR